MRTLIKWLPLLLFFPPLLVGQGIEFEKGSWKDVRAKAEQTGKVLFVNACTQWSAPCKWMKTHVFTNTHVGDFYNAAFMNYSMDVETGEGLEFAAKYGVSVYPTLLYLDSKGEMLHKHIGPQSAKAFLHTGKIAIDPDQRISNLIRRYEAGERDPEFVRMYIEALAGAGMSPKEVADAYFLTIDEDDLITAENFKLIQMMRPSMDNPRFLFVLKNRDQYGTLINPEYVKKFLRETCKSDLLRIAYSGNADAFERAVQKVKGFDLEDQDEILTYAYMKYGQKNRDYDMFIKNARAYARKYAGLDWMLLNNIAWDIYEDDHNTSEEYLDLGLDLVKKSVRIDKNYYNADTYAALAYKAGDLDKAKEWAEEAIRIARAKGEDHAMTSELLEKINAGMKL